MEEENNKNTRGPQISVKKSFTVFAIGHKRWLAYNLFKDLYAPDSPMVNKLIFEFAIKSLGYPTNIGLKTASRWVYHNREAFEKFLLIKKLEQDAKNAKAFKKFLESKEC